MSGFVPAVVNLHGRFEVDASIAEAFPLFSPEGERDWVPGWDPETLHPPGAVWEEEMLFRTREEKGDAIWVITRLDREGHNVVYHRVEPDRYVARVEVTCAPIDDRKSEATVSYTFVGLSPSGNAEIEAMNDEAYQAKLLRWKGWISEYFSKGQ